MNRALIWVGIFLTVVVVGKCTMTKMFTSGEGNSAQERVRRILDGLKSGGDRQKAVTLWKRGTFSIEPNAFNDAADEFDAWVIARGINTISNYEIGKVDVRSETERLGEAVVHVSGTIDGKPFKWRVVQGLTIQAL